MKIRLIAGHGGADSGAIAFDGTPERDRVRWFCKKLKAELETYGIIVDYESAKDKNGSFRIHKKGEYAFSMEVHHNSTKGATGTEVCTIYHPKWAALLSKRVAKAIGLRNRGCKIRKDLYTLNTSGTDVLLEIGFLDNKKDLMQYKKNYDETIEATAKCIAKEILKIKKKVYEKRFPKPRYLPKKAVSNKWGSSIDKLRVNKFLNWYGYDIKKTRNYDKKTIEAVRDFQKKHDLTIDGYFGSETKKAARQMKR